MGTHHQSKGRGWLGIRPYAGLRRTLRLIDFPSGVAVDPASPQTGRETASETAVGPPTHTKSPMNN